MSTPEWKAFQDKVAEMEPVLARAGIRVESPGKLLDRDTGQPRDIDVLVRVPYYPNPILIMIECRRHDHTQDVTWIEHLAQRRDSVGVDRVIAVSSTPFTKPAQVKAKRLGVELRTLVEVDADRLLGDAYSMAFRFERRKHDNTLMEFDCGPLLDGPDSPSPEIQPEVQRLLTGEDMDAEVFIDTRTQQPIALRSLWSYVDWDAAFADVVPGDPPVRKTFKVTIPGLPPVIRTRTEPPTYLWGVQITSDLAVEDVSLTASASYEYRADAGVMLRRLEYDLSSVGQDATLLFDIYPPDEDGCMPYVPRVRQTGDGVPNIRLKHPHSK